MNGIGVVLLVLSCFAQNIASKDCGNDAKSLSNGWDNYNWPETERASQLGQMEWECVPQFFCSKGQEYCWLSFSSGQVVLHAHVPFVTGNDDLLFKNLRDSRGKKVINLAEKIDGGQNRNLFTLKKECMNGHVVPPGHTVGLGNLARQSQGDPYGDLLTKLEVALQNAYNNNPYQPGKWNERFQYAFGLKIFEAIFDFWSPTRVTFFILSTPYITILQSTCKNWALGPISGASNRGFWPLFGLCEKSPHASMIIGQPPT